MLRALRGQVVSIIQKKPPNLTLEEAREYEEGIGDVLVHARHLVNSFHTTIRMPPEILTMGCFHLSTEEDTFSASQICRHWRDVLISSPSLWTRRFPCRHVSRTISSLERCKSLPIRLKFDPESSILALEKVLLRGNEIISFTVHHDADRMPPLPSLFALSIPSVERLHIYSNGGHDREGEQRQANDIWQDLLALRELFVCRFPVPIGQFATPNLIHLGLEKVGEGQEITIRSILDMLRGCPLLETILFVHTLTPPQEPGPDHSHVPLPKLRSIELRVYEVRSGLITYLQFPRTVAAGFRSLESFDISGDPILQTVMDSSQYVLGGIDIHTVVIAATAPDREGSVRSLVRSEGVGGSLEITSQFWYLSEVPTLLDNNGVLFSFAPCLVNVKELQIAGCCIYSMIDIGPIATAIPNLTSIYFFHCVYDEGFGMFIFALHNHDPWPPFPHLEHLTSLEPGPGLMEVCRRMRKCGIPLKTMAIGPEPSRFTPERIADLGEFAEDVRVEVPAGISEWSVGNRILDTWSGVGIPGPDTLTSLCGASEYCRLNIRERVCE